MEVTSENGRQSAIEEKSPIGDLNEVAVVSDVETEPEVVNTDGGAVVVSGVGAPPDSADQTAPLVVVVVVEEEDGSVAADDGEGLEEDGREIEPIIIDDEAMVVDGDGDGDGDGGAGFVIDLNTDEINYYQNEAIEEAVVAIEVVMVVGAENGAGELNEEVEPDRKRVRYGGGSDYDFNDDGGEPSEQQQPNNNLRLFGIDINSGNQEDGGGSVFNAGAAAAAGGGGSRSIQPSQLGLQEEDDGDVISSGGGGGGGAVDDGDGGEPSSSQQPKSGLRLFGHDI